MKTRILAMQAVITADMKYDDMRKIQKYEPEKMVLKDKDGNEKFRISIGECDSVSCVGITFAKDGDDAFARIEIPPHTERKDEYVADNYGIIIAKANEIVESMKSALDDVDAKIAAIKAGITVVE